MKLLLDSCLSKHAYLTLINLSYEVDWVAKWKSDPGDKEIIQHAHKNQRILVTLDKDFGELVDRLKSFVHYVIPRPKAVGISALRPPRSHCSLGVTQEVFKIYETLY
jgi:predicted nuclease of predicted toxin-antitoxin system